MNIMILIHFLVCKGLSSDDVGVARGSVLQEIRPRSGLKNRRFRERKVGGAIVERLSNPLPNSAGALNSAGIWGWHMPALREAFHCCTAAWNGASVESPPPPIAIEGRQNGQSLRNKKTETTTPFPVSILR